MKRYERFIIIGLVSFLILILIFLFFLKVRNIFLKQTGVYIYLTQQRDNQTFIIPVRREVKYYKKVESKIFSAMKELLKGPSEEEKKAGISTSLNENTRLLEVKVEGDTVNLDFSREVEEGGGTILMETRIAQIVCTATQFPEIEKVRFLIEGKTINYFSGEGITIVEKPVSREDLKEFDIKIIEEDKNEERNSS